MKDEIFDGLMKSIGEMSDMERSRAFDKLRRGMSREAQESAKEKAREMLRDIEEED